MEPETPKPDTSETPAEAHATPPAEAHATPPVEAHAPPPAEAQATPPAAPAVPKGPPGWEHLPALADCFYRWLGRPRVRLTLTGVILLLAGALVLDNSVWTLPLVLVGALMVAVAWIGHRLEGRFAVEWGEGGTELAFRARIRPAQKIPSALPRPATPGRSENAEREDVIEGEAHTIEIEVAELEALIAAAEAAGGAEASGGSPPHAARNLRVASNVSPSADAR